MKYQKQNGAWGTYPHRMDLTNLQKLDEFLAGFKRVVPLREVARGDDKPGIFAMRHDVDHNVHHAIAFAEWEAERGYRATYYILHTAWYYFEADLQDCLERLVELGHEVGLHSNATAVAAERFRPRERWHTPAKRLSQQTEDELAVILNRELGALRAMGLEVCGVAAHGDIRCYEMGVVNELRYTKLTLEQFGLEYDADALARNGAAIGDNHGKMHGSLLKRQMDRQTFGLLHPCHWQLPERVSA